MAVRGVFAVRRHKFAASLIKDLRGDSACVSPEGKSPRRDADVYVIKSGAAFAGRLAKIGIQCLDLVRISATLSAERLEKQTGLR